MLHSYKNLQGPHNPTLTYLLPPLGLGLKPARRKGRQTSEASSPFYERNSQSFLQTLKFILTCYIISYIIYIVGWLPTGSVIIFAQYGFK